VSSEAARVAAFVWSFAEAAAVADGTARIRARRSCGPPTSRLHVVGISGVRKGVSITATAIENFADCSEMPSNGA
jgi:hypothetical protein